jgi:hypothetical protein
VSKRAVDAVFEGLFILTDIRALLRETAPFHELDTAQKNQVTDLLNSLQQNIQILREDLG